MAVRDVLLGLLLGPLPPACRFGVLGAPPAGRFRLQALAQLSGLGEQLISLGAGTFAQRGGLLLGTGLQLGGFVLGHLQHSLNAGGRGSQRRPLQAVQLGDRVLRLTTKALNLPGRISRLTTKPLKIFVQVSGPLERSIPFGSKGGNAGFERVDMVDDLLAVKTAQYDLERRR